MIHLALSSIAGFISKGIEKFFGAKTSTAAQKSADAAQKQALIADERAKRDADFQRRRAEIDDASVRLRAVEVAHNFALQEERVENERRLAQLHMRRLELDRERLEWEKAKQLADAHERREAMRFQAEQRMREIFQAQEVHKLFDAWPLQLVPSIYLSDGPVPSPKPIKVIVAAAERLAPIRPKLEDGLRLFLERHYPFHDKHRPAQMLGDAWTDKKLRGESAILTLFRLLAPEPTLVLETEMVGEDLSLRCGYWGLAQDRYCYQSVVRIPLRQLMADIARQRAAEWRTRRDRMLANGVKSEHIERYGAVDAENLKVLEEEEALAAGGLDPEDIEPLKLHTRYKQSEADLDAATGILVACHSLAAGWILDAYHLLHSDTPPLLPSLLPGLIDALPDDRMENILPDVLHGFEHVYAALADERPAWRPDMALDLAESLLPLPDKSFAATKVREAFRSWADMRDVITDGPDAPTVPPGFPMSEGERSILERMRRLTEAAKPELHTTAAAIDAVMAASALPPPAAENDTDTPDPGADADWELQIREGLRAAKAELTKEDVPLRILRKEQTADFRRRIEAYDAEHKGWNNLHQNASVPKKSIPFPFELMEIGPELWTRNDEPLGFITASLSENTRRNNLLKPLVVVGRKAIYCRSSSTRRLKLAILSYEALNTKSIDKFLDWDDYAYRKISWPDDRCLARTRQATEQVLTCLLQVIGETHNSSRTEKDHHSRLGSADGKPKLEITQLQKPEWW